MNVPKLRFKEFSGEWEEKYLGEVVCSLDYGMGASACEYDGVNKYIRITDIDDVTHKYLDTDIVSPNGELCDKYVVRPNDILFARTGASTGKTYLYRDKDGILYFAGFLIRGSIKTEYDSRFIYNQTLTNRYKKWVSIESMRSGQPGINAEQYSDFIVNIPSYNEQVKISQLVTCVDDKIDNQYNKIASLEKQKKALIQKIFSQELRFKDDDGKEFPKWEEKKLGEVAKVYDGTHQTPNYVDSGIKFVSVEDIRSLYDSNKFITVEAFNSNFKVYPQKGDILMTRIGDIGTATLVDRDEPIAYYVSLGLMKPFGISGEFLLQYIRSNAFQHELWRRTLHIAFPKKINKNEIGECLVMVPCTREQEKIAELLSSYDDKIEVEKKSLEKWQQIKKGLLQQMFV